MNNKAFVVVGHEGFGKSETMYDLKGKLNKNDANINLNGVEFWTKTTSNKDGKKVLTSLEGEVKNNRPIVIVLCPDFNKPEKYTEKILKHLSKNYQTFFFILKKKYGKDEFVTDDEIIRLSEYGQVNICNEELAVDRAYALRKFIEEKM